MYKDAVKIVSTVVFLSRQNLPCVLYDQKFASTLEHHVIMFNSKTMFEINVLPIAIAMTCQKAIIGMAKQRESTIHCTLQLVSWVFNKCRHMAHLVVQIAIKWFNGGKLMKLQLNIVFIGFYFLYPKLFLLPRVVAIQAQKTIHGLKHWMN